MAIRDVMMRGVAVIGPERSLVDAAAQMNERSLGFLPVCEGDRLIGAITDRDIAVRAVAQGKDPTSTRVRDVMTDEVSYCFEDEEIERATALMKRHAIRRLLVVDRSQRLVGVVSLADLAMTQPGRSAELLRELTQAPPTK